MLGRHDILFNTKHTFMSESRFIPPTPDQAGKEKKEQRLAEHLEQLRAYGLYGLEGRMQRGLDPAGMLAVKETREIFERVAAGAGISIEDVETLTKALHTGAIWSNAEDLAKAEKPAVQGWMLLADECHEVNDRDLSQDEYLSDVDRIKDSLQAAEGDPRVTLQRSVESFIKSAKEKYVMKDGVAFAETDAFIYMAIGGEQAGVSKADDLYFVGADKLDYETLKAKGFTAVRKEDRGREATFYQRNGQDVVKELYPGFAIVFGDEQLALELAKTGQKE